MIGEWFVAGAAIGFKAFVAALVFAVCMCAVIALLGAIIGAIRGKEDKEE